jgi:hypothetical protein
MGGGENCLSIEFNGRLWYWLVKLSRSATKELGHHVHKAFKLGKTKYFLLLYILNLSPNLRTITNKRILQSLGQ